MTCNTFGQASYLWAWNIGNLLSGAASNNSCSSPTQYSMIIYLNLLLRIVGLSSSHGTLSIAQNFCPCKLERLTIMSSVMVHILVFVFVMIFPNWEKGYIFCFSSFSSRSDRSMMCLCFNRFKSWISLQIKQYMFLIKDKYYKK